MEKSVRCTVCTWRGPLGEAQAAPRVHPSSIPPGMEEVQHALEQRMALRVHFGGEVLPPCPVCGHHTALVRLHAGKLAV